MTPKRRVEAAEDKKEVPLAKKTQKRSNNDEKKTKTIEEEEDGVRLVPLHHLEEDEKAEEVTKKTKKEKIKETVNHSEEVAHILEDYHQGLFELLQIIAVKFNKMTDGLAETIIRDSLNEFDDRIMERKISKQVIESLRSTDNMSSVNEKTPEQDAPSAPTTGGAAASRRMKEILERQYRKDMELYETPGNSEITDRDGKGRERRALFPNSTK